MVRFSCFPSHSHFHKPKKSVQLSAEAMHKMLEDCSSSQAFRDSYMEPDLKSEQTEKKSNTESDIDVRRPTPIKKTMSLGSGLDRKGKVSGSDESEDGTDQRFSRDGSRSHSELGFEDSSLDFKIIPVQVQESVQSDSLHVNADLLNNGSVFSIGDPQHSETGGQDNPELQLSGGGKYHDRNPRSPPRIAKSISVPNMHSPVHSSIRSLHYSRSAEDLNVIDSGRKEMSTYEIGSLVAHQEEQDDGSLNNGKRNCEIVADDSYNAYDYVGSAKEWIIPVADEVTNNNHQGKTSFCRWNNLPSKDFKIKLIEEWVSGLQHYSPLEETGESSASRNYEELENDVLVDSPTPRLDGKADPSIEGVKKYLSSLSATSTAAQLANNGLVVIPLLSAFTSLRVLNLSGNSIVRITAGALPRGLHVLNLSKNNISTIEGLRELTRLRVLDISYNRILRIGHGLASCSSLKELYLAGNKISEVEGLHRLLKLNVLDFRFNKISTTKCLGQLAANYNSLQAIGLEGNPVQKNIGDEQIKKYLQCLLPRLAYYNRQPIKAGILKDAGDRSARVVISSHQIERNLRSEHKTMRKGSHGVAPHKASSSSTHGRRSQAGASSKTSRSRNGRLLPGGTKISTDRHHVHDIGSKLLNFKPHRSIQRTRSEGNLGAL